MSFKTVCIKMGSECNLDCIYCHNNNYESKKNTSKCTSELIHFLNTNNMLDSNYVISFWGGEPLLYWNEIIDVINKLDLSKIEIHIKTNGTLLTQEIVNDINRFNMFVSLSHDGEYNLITKGINVFTRSGFKDLFLQIKHKSITMVYSAFNQDLYKTWNYFNNIDPNIQIYTKLLNSNRCINKEAYNFNFDIVTKSFEKVLSIIEKSELEFCINNKELNLIRPRLLAISKFYLNKINNNTSVLNLDTEGSILTSIGFDSEKLKVSIKDTEEDILSSINEYNTNLTINDECLMCEFQNCCASKSQYYIENICKVKKILLNTAITFIYNYQIRRNFSIKLK